MTLTDRLGQAKFFYNVGKEYGEVFRGSLTGGAALTFIAKYLGLGTLGALMVGAALVPVFVLIAITAGYAVVRWRIIHATIEREWEANPFQRAQIDTLREIRDAVRADWQAYGDARALEQMEISQQFYRGEERKIKIGRPADARQE